jgi:hypothetical protein
MDAPLPFGIGPEALKVHGGPPALEETPRTMEEPSFGAASNSESRSEFSSLAAIVSQFS